MSLVENPIANSQRNRMSLPSQQTRECVTLIHTDWATRVETTMERENNETKKKEKKVWVWV
jgi:hypothetical protein